MILPQTLTVNSFENAVTEINRLCTEKPAYYVLNTHKACEDTIKKILLEIHKATPTQLLYNMDIRAIAHPTGNPLMWSLEACSPTKSLAIIGSSPTA
jgi:hypothetical protein